MKNYEIGILPESTTFSFSPTEEIRRLFYHYTMCGHLYCSKDYYIKRSSYPPLLLVYVQSGTFYLELESGNYQANAGQVMLFDCRQPHYYYAKDDMEFHFIHFDGPQARELCRYINQNSGLVIDSANNALIRQKMEEMIDFLEGGGTESAFTVSSQIYYLLSLLDNPIRSARLKKNDDSLNRAVLYIRSNYHKRITLHELAEMCGLSDFYFSHLFKEMTGLSPSSFIIKTRIDRAMVLLANTSLPLSQIARQIGYPNSSNLNVQFTRRVGCTPAEYRAMSQGLKEADKAEE